MHEPHLEAERLGAPRVSSMHEPHLEAERLGAPRLVHALQGRVPSDQCRLLVRYMQNAIANPRRRAIKSTNPKLASIREIPEGEALLVAAGWQSRGDFLVLSDDASALACAQAVLEALLASQPCLLDLPDELLHRCFATLDLADMAVLLRVSKAMRTVAAQGRVWLRFCSNRIRRQVKMAGRSAMQPPGDLGRLETVWRHVARLENIWSRLEARGGRATLANGVPPQTLAALDPRLLEHLPDSVLASLLVHDGQVSVDGLGFFFGGARLLDLSSMLSSCLREASLLPPPPAPGVAGPSDPAFGTLRDSSGDSHPSC